jgi:hypothetical protein
MCLISKADRVTHASCFFISDQWQPFEVFSATVLLTIGVALIARGLLLVLFWCHNGIHLQQEVRLAPPCSSTVVA